ncbi:hypothetical protein PHYSODRAFT_336805 [Phytophthora sojae]|uniref:Transmembrane protein n=1 Tax=Phytophthora sojae (strain P6497) TaxID=1094619 RepID=G4ZWF1_PHYSP|nr:hypothetical protein PHYSODRAFT_336805 [Phytophthora sojae]EGZ12379.1 hypothetical protein PHYSODRAFT_336805 [Phytophthora sojae]|eukprot:XP_009532712.1 hypothetical protein PHYSODRAFT_336805 [Phytophthora sojae]
MNRRTSAALREDIDAPPVQQPSKKVAPDVVKLSYWGFALWWLIILGVHVVTSVYNALYAYCYWKLKDASLLVYLEFYHIGLPQEYHSTIAVVHAVMSAVHGVCILLMLGGSLWQLSLAFSPWWDSSIAQINNTAKTNSGNAGTRKSSIITTGVVKIWGRHGFCGVNGAHFYEILIWREVIETTFQTIQAYRMSVLLPRTVLNRFYVFLLAVNCWSSIIVHSVFRKRGEAQKRLACIVCDCILDLVACMGIVLIILLSYAAAYNRETLSFDYEYWWNDEWLARALNDFQMVVVVSWSDLASRSIFSLSLVVATADMKDLLRYLTRDTKRVSQS